MCVSHEGGAADGDGEPDRVGERGGGGKGRCGGRELAGGIPAHLVEQAIALSGVLLLERGRDPVRPVEGAAGGGTAPLGGVLSGEARAFGGGGVAQLRLEVTPALGHGMAGGRTREGGLDARRRLLAELLAAGGEEALHREGRGTVQRERREGGDEVVGCHGLT